ncbi:MAG TPA: polysaccharide deacetylase family protein [Vicinamibacterales bacterium]
MFGSAHVPFGERGGRARGALDLLAGHYPAFTIGGSVGRLLPVFHFHETTAPTLEPKLQYLAGNGYSTVTSAAITAFVRDGVPPPAHSVALAFDDAWSSVWTVAGPLLRKYAMRAIVYAIPARIADAADVRPTIDDAPIDPAAVDSADNPFVTWPELRRLHDAGTFDVQSHTRTHSMIFAGQTLVDFVSPSFRRESLLNRPRVDRNGIPRFLDPGALGAPLYPRRSCMSDALRFFPDEDTGARTIGHVAANGAERFFDRPDWRGELRRLAGTPRGNSQDAAARDRVIEDELRGAREELEGRLAGHRVDHVCLPWGVAGRTTRAALERCGYRTAFANRFRGRFAVAAGDDPFALKRLSNRFIFSLPGRGRRYVFLSAR